MAIITVGALGADYTTLASAISNSANTDTIRIIDNGTYDESFPLNINWGELTFESDRTDVDDMPLFRLTGTNWNNWWNNQNGIRTFQKMKIGNMTLNGAAPTTNSGKVCIAKKLWFDAVSGNCFLCGDNDEENRIQVENCLFRSNTGIIFKQAATTNNNFNIGYCINCVFYNNTEVTDLSIANNRNDFVDMTNCVFYSNTAINSDQHVVENWTYNYTPDSTDWGANNQESSANPFDNGTLAVPSDFHLDELSLAFENGTTAGQPADDFEDTARSGANDMGIFEGTPGGGPSDGTGVKYFLIT